MGNCFISKGSKSSNDSEKKKLNSASNNFISGQAENESLHQRPKSNSKDGSQSGERPRSSSGASSRTADDIEKEVQSILAEEQKRVRIKARPLLDRRLTTRDALEIVTAFASREDRAALKIQQAVRRFLGYRLHKARQEFLIFCNQEFKIESTLSDANVPAMDTKKYLKELQTQDEFEALLARREGALPQSGDSENIISAERQKSMEKFIQLKRLEKAVYKDINNYVLPNNNISPRNAAEFIEVLRQNGKLEKRCLHKILGKAYRSLKNLPNVTKVSISSSDRITIVGDLHGQLDDLIYIIDTAGMPSMTHKILFNGDFVDRGDKGVEVIIAILVLFVAFPGSVFLNRGNHEDFSVCCLYGFQSECCEKYDETIFGMFCEVFQQIPLFAVINESVFVVHGGLFHEEGITLQDLNKIDRSNFSLRDVQSFYYTSRPMRALLDQKRAYQEQQAESEGEEYILDIDDIELENLMVAEESSVDLSRSRKLQRLQLDSLWSDPSLNHGIAYNPRGVSVQFGPDVTKRFLETNGFKMVIRSHECIMNGFDRPYHGAYHPLLATVFSASDYGGGKNSAAFITLTTEPKVNMSDGKISSIQIDSELWYTVHHYTVVQKMSPPSEKIEPAMGLVDLIRTNHQKLLDLFLQADTEKKGTVSRLTWSDCMQKGTGLKIRWITMIPYIVAEDLRKSGEIEYKGVLDFFLSDSFA